MISPAQRNTLFLLVTTLSISFKCIMFRNFNMVQISCLLISLTRFTNLGNAGTLLLTSLSFFVVNTFNPHCYWRILEPWMVWCVLMKTWRQTMATNVLTKVAHWDHFTMTVIRFGLCIQRIRWKTNRMERGHNSSAFTYYGYELCYVSKTFQHPMNQWTQARITGSTAQL